MPVWILFVFAEEDIQVTKLLTGIFLFMTIQSIGFKVLIQIWIDLRN